ncbi:MAG TPA: DUF5668 domain-containing protein [Anaerolineaceae bacterium]
MFWPIVLIGVGIIWLMGNIGAIAAFDLPVLFRLWPLLLVFLGLDFLIGRRSPLVGAVLGVLAVVLVAGFLLGGRAFGLSSNVQVKTERFSTPIDEATSASVLLAFSDSPASVSSLSGSADLIEADLTYIGAINFRATGTARKVVRLARNEADFLLFTPLYWDPSLNWQIQLTPRIPLALTINGGSGESRLDLSLLQLTSLKVSMGSGASAFTAPASGSQPLIEVSGGSGSMDWTIPAGAGLEMRVSGGSGSINIHLPSAPVVELDLKDKDAGSVSFPTGWVQAPAAAGSQATWETPGFAPSPHAVRIIIEHAGSGSIHIG